MTPYRGGAIDVATIALTIPTMPPRTLMPAAAPSVDVTLDATIEAASGLAYAFEGLELRGARLVPEPYGGPLWICDGGRRVHARIASDGAAEGTVGAARAIFRREDGEVRVADASFRIGPRHTLVLPSGESTTPSTFYTGPSGPNAQRVIVNASPHGEGEPPAAVLDRSDTLRVGAFSHDDDGSPPLAACFAHLSFEAWVDDPYAVITESAPSVRIGAGVLHCRGVSACSSWFDEGRTLPCASFAFDPREPDGHLAVGRHPLLLRWSTQAGALATTVFLVVTPDGTTTLEGGAGAPVVLRR